ncbi:hypothetical protein HAX54_048358, partial [Datura stramonium]|nr:hypothetical protein [Datura stramonium]
AHGRSHTAISGAEVYVSISYAKFKGLVPIEISLGLIATPYEERGVAPKVPAHCSLDRTFNIALGLIFLQTGPLRYKAIMPTNPMSPRGEFTALEGLVDTSTTRDRKTFFGLLNTIRGILALAAIKWLLFSLKILTWYASSRKRFTLRPRQAKQAQELGLKVLGAHLDLQQLEILIILRVAPLDLQQGGNSRIPTGTEIGALVRHEAADAESAPMLLAFHTEVSTVNDISPSVNYMTLTVNYILVEIGFPPVFLKILRFSRPTLSTAQTSIPFVLRPPYPSARWQ